MRREIFLSDLPADATRGNAGKTWSGMQLIDLPNPNSGTDAVTLADGRHVLVYNHTTRVRSPLNVALSTALQKFLTQCAADAGPDRGASEEHIRRRSVTSEQRRAGPAAANNGSGTSAARYSVPMAGRGRPHGCWRTRRANTRIRQSSRHTTDGSTSPTRGNAHVVVDPKKLAMRSMRKNADRSGCIWTRWERQSSALRTTSCKVARSKGFSRNGARRPSPSGISPAP